MKPDTDVLYSACARLMREAGKIILSAHGADDCLHSKSGTQNFVTDYDVAVQKNLIEGLRECFPDATFIAEEKDNDPAVLERDLCFIIDPIDGTTSFIHGCRSSAISLGAVSHGEVIFGAIYNPYTDELFHASLGGGAFVNDTPIHVSDRPMRLGVLVFGTCPYYKDTLSEPSFRMAREVFCACTDLHRCGSAALDITNIARGSCDVFFEMILQPWDIAAGKLLVEEAGGIMTQFDGSPITFERPVSVLIGTPQTYPELKKIASRYLEYVDRY